MQEFVVNQQVTHPQPDAVSSSPMDFEALEFAVITGDATNVQTLLSTWPEQGNDNRPISSLKKFLVDAIRARDLRIVELFLAKKTPFDLSHVQLAIEMRSIPILQSFHEHGWNINESVDWATPPTLSFALDDEGLSQWFLDHGADPNIRPNIDCTPLSMAVLRAPVHIIELLLSRGGTVSHGQLVHYAASREGDDRLEVLELLLSRKAPGLNEIMYHDSPESFDMLKDFGLGTPLHLAAEKGHTDVVQYLLRKGVDPETRDSCGRLALDRAQRNEHSDVVELLRPFSTAS